MLKKLALIALVAFWIPTAPAQAWTVHGTAVKVVKKASKAVAHSIRHPKKAVKSVAKGAKKVVKHL